jgi:hypothetical protein
LRQIKDGRIKPLETPTGMAGQTRRWRDPMGHWDRADRQIANMSEMMQRLGLDPASVAQQGLGIPFAQAIRRCQSCDAGEVCCDWLQRAAVHLQHPPAFCANASLFEHLLEALPPPSDARH